MSQHIVSTGASSERGSIYICNKSSPYQGTLPMTLRWFDVTQSQFCEEAKASIHMVWYPHSKSWDASVS